MNGADLAVKALEANGVKVLCNLPYSGTEVIKDYGELHLKTGNPIVYTSADSVFQIAAHIAGHKVVRLAVEENDRHFAGLQRLDGGGLL